MSSNDAKHDLYESSVRLCRAIEAQPCIYDRTNELYAAKWAALAAWEKIAITCNDTPANCKLRWSHIRTAFTRASYGSKKRSANRSRDYYLQDVLKFLEPHIWNFNDLDTEEPIDDALATEEAAAITTEVNKTVENKTKQAATTNILEGVDDIANENNQVESSEDVKCDIYDEENDNQIEKFFIKRTKSSASLVGKKSTEFEKRKAPTLGIESTSNTMSATITKSGADRTEDPLDQPMRVLRASKRTLDKSLEHKDNKNNNNNKNEPSSSKNKDLKNKSGEKIQQREPKRRRQTARHSMTPTKPNQSPSRKSIENDLSTSKESEALVTSAPSLSSSSAAEASKKPATANQKNSNRNQIKNTDKFNAKPKITGVHVISPSKSTASSTESSTSPLSPNIAEPDYFDDLLMLAERKAKEFEAEEILRANAPLLYDKPIQCKMHITGVDMEFLEDIKQHMLDMNARQKMHFKHKVYKCLMDVFDNAVDFPTDGQVIPINGNSIPQLEKNLQPKEIYLMRELVSMVLSVKKTPELFKPTTGTSLNSANVNGLAISNTNSGSTTCTSNNNNHHITISQDSSAIQIKANAQPNKFIKASHLVATAKPTTSGPALRTTSPGATAAPTSELNLPTELLNEAIKISVNGGGSITATDGNRRRVYRIYPRGSPVNRATTSATITASTTSTATNSGTFIIPQSSATNTASVASTHSGNAICNTTATTTTTTSSGTANIVSQSGVVLPRPITISARPIIINNSNLGSGSTMALSPQKLLYGKYPATPNDAATNQNINIASNGQSAITIRRLTQSQQQLETQNSSAPVYSLPSLNHEPSLIRTINQPVRRYSLCNPQALSNYNNNPMVVAHYNPADGSGGRISPNIITTTIHGTPFSQSVVTSQENSRRSNEPMVSFKRARYPHVTQSSSGHTTHGISTSRIVASASSGSATNVNQNNAISTSTTTTTLSSPSLLKPVPIIIRPAGINTTTSATTKVAQIKKNMNIQRESSNDNAGIITADEFPVKVEPLDEDAEFPSLLI